MNKIRTKIRFNDNTEDLESWSKPIIPILNGYNYLDMGWDPNGDIWAGGGNGTLIVSNDDGQTWNSDPVASSLPTNYYILVLLLVTTSSIIFLSIVTNLLVIHFWCYLARC